MRRDVAAILLILLGGAVLRITLDGAFINYVKPGMRPYLLASSLVLLILGVLAFVDAIRNRTDNRAQHDHGDGHHHERMGTAWLLLLPVAAIFLVAPGPLGAYTAEREGATVTAPKTSSTIEELPPGDPVALSLQEYAVRAVWDNGRTLEGRDVELIGFVTPDAQDGGWVLTRLTLACCAADALAIKVRPVGEVPELPANTWVALTGRYVPGGGTGSSDAVPWIELDRLIQVPQPTDPYL